MDTVLCTVWGYAGLLLGGGHCHSAQRERGRHPRRPLRHNIQRTANSTTHHSLTSHLPPSTAMHTPRRVPTGPTSAARRALPALMHNSRSLGDDHERLCRHCSADQRAVHPCLAKTTWHDAMPRRPVRTVIGRQRRAAVMAARVANARPRRQQSGIGGIHALLNIPGCHSCLSPSLTTL